MRVCIHRGTQEVGGTCIEIEAEGKRIVLDVGLPLSLDFDTGPSDFLCAPMDADPHNPSTLRDLTSSGMSQAVATPAL